MRHIWTLIAAVIIAPLAWLLIAYGEDRSLQAFANQEDPGGLSTGDFIRPTLCLAAAGLLFGLIATLRFSPLGAVVAGASYAGSYVALLISPAAVVDLFPDNLSLAGRDVDPTTPLRTGVTLLLGALLLVAVASRGRWRRWPVADTGPTDETPDASAVSPDDRPVGVDGIDLSPLRYGADEGSREPAWASRTSDSTTQSSWPPRGPR